MDASVQRVNRCRCEGGGVMQGDQLATTGQRDDVGLSRAVEGCSRKTGAASHCTRVNLFREH
jgi:hypothetical protein